MCKSLFGALRGTLSELQSLLKFDPGSRRDLVDWGAFPEPLVLTHKLRSAKYTAQSHEGAGTTKLSPAYLVMVGKGSPQLSSNSKPYVKLSLHTAPRKGSASLIRTTLFIVAMYMQ